MISEAALKDLRDALPYSVIPNMGDAKDFVEYLLEQGWTPPDDA